MFKIVLAAVLLASSISAVAGNAPLSVSTKGVYVINNPNLPAWQLTLTSLDNDITIQSMLLNRGNCNVTPSGKGKHLVYGQTFSFTTPSSEGFIKCRPLELTVQTNKGTFNFNWQ